MDGCPPELVQLCSSPTHPPDCDRNEQLSYIHHRLDRTFLDAATDPSHRLHKAALGPRSELKAGKGHIVTYQKHTNNMNKLSIAGLNLI